MWILVAESDCQLFPFRPFGHLPTYAKDSWTWVQCFGVEVLIQTPTSILLTANILWPVAQLELRSSLSKRLWFVMYVTSFENVVLNATITVCKLLFSSINICHTALSLIICVKVLRICKKFVKAMHIYPPWEPRWPLNSISLVRCPIFLWCSP